VKTFYVIDGHAQLFRAYYAPFRDLTAPNGEPVKAVYVFTQLLLNVLRNVKPDYLAIAWDVSDSTTLRKGDYAEYKANRDHAPDDLHTQYARIRQVVEAMGIKTYEVEGHEADDVIATIAERLKDEDVELRIASKDKDLHQVLSDKVKLWDPSSGELLGPRELLETRGYTPEQSVEVQTLTGDSTDNIPGAKGVGTKTAAKLIAKYGSADAVMEHLDELTPKLAENLAAHRANMALTRRLVTLERDVPLDFRLEDCVTPRPLRRDLRQLFEELGFRSFLDQLDFAEPGAVAAATEATPSDVEGAGLATDYRVVNTPEAFAAFVAELERQEAFALDTETTALRAVDAEIVGYVFSWQAGTGWYVPVRGAHGETLDPAMVAARLKPILEDEKTLKVGQNLKYDIIALANAGIELKGPLFDTMVAAALLYPGRRTYNMDDLARDLLGVKTTPISDLIGKGKDQLSMLDVPLEQIAAYAAEDADITWRLYERLAKGIDAEPVDAEEARSRSRAAGSVATLKQLFTEVEMPLVRVLSDMEREGVSLDADMLKAYAETIKRRIEELKARMVEVVGVEFNPDSPKQLAEVLFDKLGMRVVKTTKTGRSTDAEVLETLAAETDHPLLPLLLEYRELNKILGTYLLPLPGYLSPVTGRLHASFPPDGRGHRPALVLGPEHPEHPHPHAGRSRDQARVPRPRPAERADHGRLLAGRAADAGPLLRRPRARQGVQGGPGHPRLRRVAGLRRADRGGHAGPAAHREDGELRDHLRPDLFGLARTLRIPRSDAQRFIDEYKERYAGLDRFLRTCIEEAEDLGYVTTILGRRREIPEIRSRNRNQRFLGERLAINSVIQGSAADLIKVAMVKLAERLRVENLGGKILIQVHDELVLEAPRDVSDEVVQATVDVMSNALPLRVPLKVDASVGTNWLEVKA